MTTTTKPILQHQLITAIRDSERGGSPQERYERFRGVLHSIADKGRDEGTIAADEYARLKRYLSNTRVDSPATVELHTLLKSLEDLRRTIVSGFSLRMER